VDARRAAVAEAEENVRVAQSAIDQANARIAQADASIESALTAPQQVAISQARAKCPKLRCSKTRCCRTGPAESQLLHDCRSGKRHRRKEERRGGKQRLTGPGVDGSCTLDDIWVTADFKEAQLRHMKAGQRVTFSVDAYGREYKGRVTGIGGASGSLLSLLPPENATGNFVKVVQRLPVRIDIDPNQNDDHRLRPGMSVEPKVYVR
jgi:membrane fusion protein, multidrug efflux system